MSTRESNSQYMVLRLNFFGLNTKSEKDLHKSFNSIAQDSVSDFLRTYRRTVNSEQHLKAFSSVKIHSDNGFSFLQRLAQALESLETPLYIIVDDYDFAAQEEVLKKIEKPKKNQTHNLASPQHMTEHNATYSSFVKILLQQLHVICMTSNKRKALLLGINDSTLFSTAVNAYNQDVGNLLAFKEMDMVEGIAKSHPLYNSRGADLVMNHLENNEDNKWGKDLMTNLYNPLLAIAALHNNQKDFKANLHRAELEHLQGAALIQALQKETKKKKEAKQTT